MNKENMALKKGELAEKYFREGKSCCQSVLLAFKEETGLDEEFLLKLGAPFGGGIGRMREVCGAAIGAFMLAGLLKSDGSKENRDKDYTLVRKIAEAYSEKNGSFICAELLKGVKLTDGATPEERDEGYYRRRPCPALCRSAAEIAARYLSQE